MANLETWLAEENSIIQKPDNEKQAYLYEWLERLIEHLNNGKATNVEIKKIQPKIVSTLHKILEINCSPATQQQLALCFAAIFNASTTLGLFDSVNKCVDIIKSRDDSTNNQSIKLSAICCMGGIYKKLGRMVGALFDVGLQSLTKILYKSESQAKCEILLCFQKMLFGLGNAASSGYKDIYKACKACLVDKSMSVRWAAAKCALELSKHANFLCTTDLETMVSTCLKALEGSNYDVRVQVAQLLGILMAGSQKVVPNANKNTKKISIEDVFGLMASAFLKGGIGFLKSGGIIESGLNREIRVGVTQAYVVFFHEMGTKWVSKYLAGVIIHILELAASQKATATHIDAVYSRKCVSFILHSVFHGMLPERSQVHAVKELCKVITKQMNNIHQIVSSENNSDSAFNIDVISTQHVLVCALAEISNLVLALTSSVKAIMNDTIVEAVFSTLIHPVPAVWLSAAWCIRSCTIAISSNMTNLIDVCMNKMKILRSSVEAVTGYGYTLAAIIGGLYKCPLGLPFAKAKTLFSLTMDLLQNGGKNGKLALCKVQTGWVLLGALCTLGPSFIRSCIPDMLQIWSSVFPANNKDVDAEQSRGNLKTWQLTLENRAGALCSMASFVTHCKQLLVPDVVRKMMVPVEAALVFFQKLQNLVKTHGSQLQPSVAMFKSRLYHLLSKLQQPRLFEGFFTPLLRDLVTVFTLANQKGSTMTSLLQSLCHKDDSLLLGSWLQETDHKDVEEQLQLNSASGSGALEHDSACVYAACKNMKFPGPLPLGVAVIDNAIVLFGHIFPFVTNKHRSQLMSHFNECIVKSKGSRQQAIQTNIFTAFLAALKNLAENKSVFGEESVRSHANILVQDALANTDNILRCAAGEALGRMAQVMNDPEFVAATAQASFEKCQKTPDAIIRTGHALALGCLHRYVGGMGSGHHLVNSVSILIALAKDASSTLVQIWSMHGLTLIADSGGPMFRTFVDQSLYTVINLLLQTPPFMTEVHQCLGKCIGALITAIGPELQDTSKVMERSRLFCMTACSIMQNHPDSLVQSEAIRCLQQLHLFAPNVVNLNTLVPHLCQNLLSPHLILRRASVDCMRQLSHREARDICQLGKSIVENNEEVTKKMYIGNKGLEGLLFSLLDAEVESRLLKHIRETITSMLQARAATELKHWLGLCKQVLLASNVEDAPEKPAVGADDDDGEEGNIVVSSKDPPQPTISPKWPTRVFAMECTRMILEVCKAHKEHTDLTHARLLKEKNPADEFLVTQLSELVRMAFIAGTSTNDLLKLEGMKTLQDVVVLFANVPDPDIPGHLILEQFQAQVGTALRPAFADNVPPDVRAMACEVCSSWIGCGISRDINDVRRIQQLLVNSLEKIDSSDDLSKLVYSESAYTLQTLAVLKAWAQIYIMAIKHESESGKPSEEEYTTSSLLDLVEKDLKLLVKHWIGAARDYVLLTLPVQYASQLPLEGGTFYSAEMVEEVRSHYKQAWPPMIHAIALWLTNVAFKHFEDTVIGAGDEVPARLSMDTLEKSHEEINRDRFHLIAGICIEAMCSPMATYPQGTVETCIDAVNALLESNFGRTRIVHKNELCIELLTVLYRLLLSYEEIRIQQTILDIVFKCTQAYDEKINSREEVEDDTEPKKHIDQREEELVPKKSVVFSILEVCTYMVTKYAHSVMPESTQKMKSNSRKYEFSLSSVKLLSHITSILSQLPDLCSPSASVVCLPTIVFLSTTVLKYIAVGLEETFQNVSELKLALEKIIRSFKKVITSEHGRNELCVESWEKIIQSSFMSLLQIPRECVRYTALKDASSPGLALWENLLLSFSVFILHTPNQAVSKTVLLTDCIEVFVDVIKYAPAKLRLYALKIIESMVKSVDEDISIPFIRQCVPHVVGILEEAQTNKPSCDVELTVCRECISLIEIVLAMVEDGNRVHMMSIYVTVLIYLLYDSSSLSKANGFSRSLHEFCIQRLTATGPLYPLAFRSIMGGTPELKDKLTAGIKANEAIKTARKNMEMNKSSEPVQPQIKLKMDFSNFK